MTTTLPNALTIFRFVAVPALLWLLWADGGAQGPARWWAWALFVAAAVSDFLDGFLARRWKVVSSFGKLADPIADKALVLGTLVGLVFVDGLAWWPLAILLVREVGITVGRLAVAHSKVIAASWAGKLKTVMQIGALLLLLVPSNQGWTNAVGWAFLLAAVVVAVWSGVQYARVIAAAARTS